MRTLSTAREGVSAGGSLQRAAVRACAPAALHEWRAGARARARGGLKDTLRPRATAAAPQLTETHSSLHTPATHVSDPEQTPQLVVTPQSSVKEPQSRPADEQLAVCGRAPRADDETDARPVADRYTRQFETEARPAASESRARGPAWGVPSRPHPSRTRARGRGAGPGAHRLALADARLARGRGGAAAAVDHVAAQVRDVAAVGAVGAAARGLPRGGHARAGPDQRHIMARSSRRPGLTGSLRL